MSAGIDEPYDVTRCAADQRTNGRSFRMKLCRRWHGCGSPYRIADWWQRVVTFIIRRPPTGWWVVGVADMADKHVINRPETRRHDVTWHGREGFWESSGGSRGRCSGTKWCWWRQRWAKMSSEWRQSVSAAAAAADDDDDCCPYQLQTITNVASRTFCAVRVHCTYKLASSYWTCG